jgi:hypothetical protein
MCLLRHWERTFRRIPWSAHPLNRVVLDHEKSLLSPQIDSHIQIVRHAALSFVRGAPQTGSADLPTSPLASVVGSLNAFVLGVCRRAARALCVRTRTRRALRPGNDQTAFITPGAVDSTGLL